MRVTNELGICERKGVKPDQPISGSKIGIAIETIGQLPINGLRHKPENGTSGWYIWCGSDFSDEADFFSPLCIEHVNEYIPGVAKYLNLPPGYRFLVDDRGYEDVWFDAELLNA